MMVIIYTGHTNTHFTLALLQFIFVLIHCETFLLFLFSISMIWFVNKCSQCTVHGARCTMHFIGALIKWTHRIQIKLHKLINYRSNEYINFHTMESIPSEINTDNKCHYKRCEYKWEDHIISNYIRSIKRLMFLIHLVWIG